MGVAEEVGAAAAAFVATDLDDMVVLSVLFAHRRDRARDIVAGQYLGIAALVGAGIAAGAGLAELPDAAVRLLGLVPIGLGLWLLLRGGDGDDAAPGRRLGVLGVAAITVANGGDNIAVYAPYFAATDAVLTTVIVFAAGVALWCAIAAFVGSRPAFRSLMEAAGHWVVPAVLIALGVYLVTLA